MNEKASRNPGGRPPKLFKTPDILNRLGDSIRAGSPYSDACRAAGISFQTFLHYKARAVEAVKRRDQGAPAEKGDRAFIEFLERVEQAESQAVDDRVRLVAIAGKNDWRAAAWFLERRRPADFGTRARVEVSGPDGAPVEMARVSKVALEAAREAMRKKILREAGVSEAAVVVAGVATSVTGAGEHENPLPSTLDTETKGVGRGVERPPEAREEVLGVRVIGGEEESGGEAGQVYV